MVCGMDGSVCLSIHLLKDILVVTVRLLKIKLLWICVFSSPLICSFLQFQLPAVSRGLEADGLPSDVLSEGL